MVLVSSSGAPKATKNPKKKAVWEMTKEEQKDDTTVVFDFDELLEFAEGNIAPVFGPEYKIIDSYERRVRLPAREYLLVTRVTKMDAETNNFRVGASMTTEYDIPYNDPLSEGGDVPWAVLVESGQCDLMLISYMGIDFQNKSDRVYRLLDTTLTFYGVASEGETLTYDIKVNGFAKGSHGAISMFFFSYDCYCNGRLLIEMRNGAAGFFTDEELAAGKGVLKTNAEIEARKKIVKQDNSAFLIDPCSGKTRFSEEDMQGLVDRQWKKVLNVDLDYKLCARKMLMIDRVTHLIKDGGAYGYGLIVGEKILERHHWYFPCHFVKDQVMAGSLVSDGCSQLLKLYMIWLGLHNVVDDFQFRPVDGQPNKVRCRGQISPHKGKLVYVMEIRELGFDSNNNPYAIADVDIIDVNFEKNETFDFNDLDNYGKGDMSKKIVVDFKGIALRLKGTPKSFTKPKSSAAVASSPTSNLVECGSPPPIPAHHLKGDPLAPKEMTWHPMAGVNGNPTPSFSPSAYPPRPIVFSPFPGNPNDNNYKPGEIPLNWFNMAEFMAGKVSKCLGDEFNRFDESNTSRSPAFDLALVTRVLEVSEMEYGQFFNIDCNPSKGRMIAEFDCPADAWFFKGNSRDNMMPYSIIMEIALQTSGILTSWVKAPLTLDKDDVLFRNLDATAECHKVVDLRGKTIKNVTYCTGYSMLGKMGIHKFHFDLIVDEEVFYSGNTSFGWFIPEVFESQVGIDNGKRKKPWYVETKVPDSKVRTYEQIDTAQGKAKLIGTYSTLSRRSPQCEFLDTLHIVPDSGIHGKGYVHGAKTVNPNDWFFSCHFWFDPVMPGSLGIESMFQLLEAFAIAQDLPAKYGIANPMFSHTTGKTTWKYRGQLTPKNKKMDSEIHISSIEQQQDGSLILIADGYLHVDDLRVYHATMLRLRVEAGKPSVVAPSSLPSQPTIVTDETQLKAKLLDLETPFEIQGKIVEPVTLSDLGDPSFMEFYGVKAPLYTGAMAKGIASADLVIAAGKSGILASLGAGGLPMHLVKQSLEKIQNELGNKPFAVNLIHSPFNPNLEEGNVDLFLERAVRIVEASAFTTLTIQVVRYRAAGLSRNPDGSINVGNKLIAKCSRTELAEMFLRPAPEKFLEKLMQQGKITPEQAELARKIPICDDIAVEADSGGHTDNRPIHVILPLIIALRNRIMAEMNYPPQHQVRVGAGGGIGCPQAALAAFSMGAAFVVTGTINQMSRQSGTCDQVRKVLSEATYSDICMAPAADMFEEGVELQVLKKGTMFPSRAKKLFEVFCKYSSLDEIPKNELERLEKRTFKKSVAEVWEETKDFYINRLHDEEKIKRAEKDGKLKMGLVFRWYLGLSSFWANAGVMDRKLDMQIWCGPCIGAFNDWIKGSYLDPEVSGVFPSVDQVNLQLLRGACYLHRLQQLKRTNIRLNAELTTYKPDQEL